MEFLEGAMMRRAKGLLFISGRGLAEIAGDCGYSSVHYFFRVFKKAVGTPPGEFRAKLQGRR